MDEYDDLYGDLDVYEEDNKKQQECVECIELRVKLKEAQDLIEKLKSGSTTIEANMGSLLITAKAELDRKNAQIHELRKEKDNIIFRRKKPPQNVQNHCVSTQSTITCKPFLVYELKKIDETQEKIIDRNRRDEGNNPFMQKSKEQNEVKPNHRNSERNGNHRITSRHHDDYSNSRSKYSNERAKGDRREQNSDRSKRKRSRSLSNDRKRSRRSRSRSRRRDRGTHDRNSPDKASRNQASRDKNRNKDQPLSKSPQQTTNKPDTEKVRNKKMTNGDELKQLEKTIKTEIASPNDNLIEIEKPTEIIDSKMNLQDIKVENAELPAMESHNDDALEEGEIDDLDQPKLVERKSSRRLQSEQLQLENNNKLEPCHLIENEQNKKKSSTVQNGYRRTPTKLDVASNCSEDKSSQHISNEIFATQMESIPNVQLEVNVKPEKRRKLIPAPEIELKPELKMEVDIELNLEQKSEVKFETNEVICELNSDVAKKETTNENQVKNIKLEHENSIQNEQKNTTEAAVAKSDESVPPATLSTNPNENDKNKHAAEIVNDQSQNGSILNTSGNKSVKNISTSSRDYLIVEDENNETTIYITRKKKKKKKSTSKNQ